MSGMYVKTYFKKTVLHMSFVFFLEGIETGLLYMNRKHMNKKMHRACGIYVVHY